MRTTRIACWSGPRSLSTALMRAWGNRADTIVTDEPLYAHYLSVTGADHPGRDEILASQPTDWEEVVEDLTGPPPAGDPIWYQKHMAHHLTDEVGLDWIAGFRNALLIRDPREVLLSLTRITPDVDVADTGLEQQVRLYEWLSENTDSAPPILDARDLLENPEAMLKALCAGLGVDWDAAMTWWSPGPRDSDGVWGKHWYGSVESTMGFGPYRAPTGELDDRYTDTLARCRELYDRLHADRLTA